ncbi:MAG: hypothetical protein HY302_07070 [Opitutae bacterium]|nr:hypothetical protein [Opitutae bacterium]
MSNTPSLKPEFDYYIANQKKLVAEHGDKFVVIKNQQVIGAYTNELEAVRETRKSHELGTFLVQHCQADGNNYSQTFHSRVAFG